VKVGRINERKRCSTGVVSRSYSEDDAKALKFSGSHYGGYDVGSWAWMLNKLEKKEMR
jgi:hypothetical protein